MNVIPWPFFFFKRAITIWWPWRKLPRIYIPPNYENAKPLGLVEAHEGVHVRQWQRLGRFGFLRRYITKRGRMELEVEAFAESAAWWVNEGASFAPTGQTWLVYYATAMSKKYGGLGYDACLTALIAETFT